MRTVTSFSKFIPFISISLLSAASFASAPQPTPTALQHPASATEIELDRIEGNVIHFRAAESANTPPPFKTELFDLKYLGSVVPLNATQGLFPYFFFSAQSCKDCQKEQTLYALRPSGGKPTAFVYPGKIFDHKTRALVLESRAFIGRCLTRKPHAVYLVFQKERIDRRPKLQTSVFVAEPGIDHLDERLIEKNLPRLQDTLQLVRTKACREIEGHNRIMPAKAAGMNFRRVIPDADDDDDSPTPPRPLD